MTYFCNFTAKRPLTFLLVIIVTCQLILFSSFLFSLAAVLAAEEESSGAEPSVETAVPESAASIITESPSPIKTATEINSETPTEASLETIIETPAELTTEQNSAPEGSTVSTDKTAPTEMAPDTEQTDATSGVSGETGITTLESSTADQKSGTPRAIILGTGDNINSGSGISQTGLTVDNGGEFQPIILAEWVMNSATNTDEQYAGSDDSDITGAQFLPSGQMDVSKDIVVCALVTDNNGAADTDGVYAKIYYPENISLALSRRSEGGCGKIYGEEFSLELLSQNEGNELFCNKLKNSNNNLPIFNANKSFDSICTPNEESALLTAKIYCANKKLAYDDPAGDYKVEIYAQDKSSNTGLTFTSTFKYLELTAFAIDFNNINYGSVQLNTPKIIEGNLDWEDLAAASPATIRNVGNTRMQLFVKQNDFGLGKTAYGWNVNYQARIGSNAAFVFYPPEKITMIGQTMDLAEVNALDFGIEVYNFPSELASAYTGQMTLTADKAEYLSCY